MIFEIEERLLEEIHRRTCRELSLGYLRYEALRKLNPLEFGDLFRRNLNGENFDAMVDELVLANKT